jgi:RNA polymerase sigma-70 factor (ECF subfamily)
LLDYSSVSSEELVLACLSARNQAAWYEFVRRFQPLIASVAFRTARQFGESSPAVIDDLVQDTFLKLCNDDARLLRNFIPAHKDSIFGFIKVVTANLVYDHFKALNSLKRGHEVGTDGTELEAARESSRPLVPSAVERSELQVLLSQIDQCLKSFDHTPTSARDRRIFWLYYRTGLSASAISSLPGIHLTVKGIESSLMRMTRLIRQKLVRVEPTGSASVPGVKGVQSPEPF